LLHSEGEPVSRDRLIDELWGEQAPSTAISSLHVHLSKPRQLLDGLIIRVPGRISDRARDDRA
jgi:DNA-binding SARP family transcriptional activator